MIKAKWRTWIYPIICLLFLLKVEGVLVDITYVESAVAKGAVCLDGSPPAYHLSPGFGMGANNWLVHIEGGGWCNNVTTCLFRKSIHSGSSKYMSKRLNFTGILSNERALSPDFYNWNKVKIRYCDGSSFTGDVESVDLATGLHYRGARVWLAVMEDLLIKGMNKAENALISGCSAGGLTSILHCDGFRRLLPTGAKVKCLSDAGFFINAKDVSGQDQISAFFNDVVTTHGSAKNLPSSCTSRLAPAMCFFPQYSARSIKTPLFVLNTAYDSWQIRNILVPRVADPGDSWHDCKLNINSCSSAQLKVIQGFREEFINALTSLGNSASRGFFVNSCFDHCQAERQESWYAADSPVLGKTPIAEAVGNWYYDRSPFQKIDCPYPCDSSCYMRASNKLST